MQAWGVVNLMLPWGSDYSYDSATIDMYNSVEEFLNDGDMEDYFTKVHAGKDIDKLFAETDANSDLIRSEIRKIVDFYWAE